MDTKELQTPLSSTELAELLGACGKLLAPADMSKLERLIFERDLLLAEVSNLEATKQGEDHHA